ncbi:MAG: hypothetical protein ACK5ZH_01950 [Alphaproteobacteria bacterium]
MGGIPLDEWNGSKAIKQSIEDIRQQVADIDANAKATSDLMLGYTKKIFILTILIAILTVLTTFAAIITIIISL